MKKAKVTVTFNVCDDFEAGVCPQCPYQTRTYLESPATIQEIVKCRIGYAPATCPAVVLDEKEEELCGEIIDANPFGTCSKCGELLDRREYYRGHKFCPKCGIRIDLVKCSSVHIPYPKEKKEGAE